MRRQRVLVTGATGFVGRHLVHHLAQIGWHVHVIVRPDSDCSQMDDLCGQISIHEHAGTTECMLTILKNSTPDIVFHLASLYLSEHQPTDIDQLLQSNLVFGTHVIEAMTQAGVSALVNAGTSWQHYENRDYSPVNLYAATKQAFEDLLQYYIEARGLRVITLKLFDTYGPDDPRPKLLSLLRHLSTESQPLAMSPGEQMIDLVHIDDVVAAFLIAAERILNGQVAAHEHYGVCSGDALSLRELVGKIQEVLGKPLPIKWGGRPYRAREVFRLWEGPLLPNWKPKITLAAGLEEVFGSLCSGER